MAGIRNIQQGIQAIQDGNHGEGARLIQIALKDESIAASLRATGYIWLAETEPEPQFKTSCYQRALALDPTNAHAKQRLDWILNSNLPTVQQTPAQPQTIPQATAPVTSAPPAHLPTTQQPPMPQTPPPPPTTPASATFYRTVGILDGHNGAGTGFFVHKEGIIATTRTVISGLENVTLTIAPGRQMIGKVVRSYPEYDLAFVQTDLRLTQLLPFSNASSLAENSEIKAFYHAGQQPLRGRCRATKREMKPYWFPTTIRQMGDVGGNPVFDEHNYVVGMLTRNASRSSDDVFGLHISHIMRQLAEYLQALQAAPQRTYCAACGYASRAESVHGFYCEACGSILPQARNINRMPNYANAQTLSLYSENLQHPCPHCQAQIGYYNRSCLRCGGEV